MGFRKLVCICAGGAIAVAAASGAAHAQADLNIQSRIDAVTAPFQVQPVLPDTAGRSVEVVLPAPARLRSLRSRTVIRKLSDKQVEIEALKAAQNPAIALKPEFQSLIAQLGSKDVATSKKRLLLALPIQIAPSVRPGPRKTTISGPPEQPTRVKFSFPLSPIYETNALKSNTSASDTSISLGGGVQVTTQGFRNLDVAAFSVGATSLRYANLSSKSIDTLTASAAYQFFLGAYDRRNAPLDVSKGTNLSPNLITFNTLTVGLQNTTAFVPTFRSESVDLFTPNVAYGWQNIPLGSGECSSKLQPGVHGFCYYSDVVLTVGHTVSDLAALQNTNVALSVTFGDRINETDFVLALAATVTGKAYEYVLGGRNDLFLQVGPKLQYTPSPNVSASMALTYNRNYSTLSAAEWSGWIVQPTLSMSFVPADIVPAKK